MPRLFWKLFFSLWMSIMAFAVVVSWINQSVVLRQQRELPMGGVGTTLERVRARLSQDMRQGDDLRIIQALQRWPRALRNHIFVLTADGRELLGREQLLERLRHGPAAVNSQKYVSIDGKVYTLISVRPRPPRGLLEPGPRGVGLRLGVAALISALVSFLLARYLAAPLGQLSQTSRQLATGDLSVRVGSPMDQRHDEFGQLALDMDEMAQRLQTSQQANQRLLRDVSHELRSPLARLRVALEIARNKDQSTVVEELNRIELESERLENLVDEVLGLLRESADLQQLRGEEIDLVALLQDLVTTVNYEISEQQEPVQLTGDPRLMLTADRELLWRAFENLLRNALQHAGKRGPIELSAKLAPGNEIHVSVKDSGVGVPQGHLARIFEPFYRLDPARSRHPGKPVGGHGLGLAIAASAVRRHGGRITATNRASGGLKIEVVLPAGSAGSSA